MWLLVITEGEGPALLRSLVSTVHSLQSSLPATPDPALPLGQETLTWLWTKTVWRYSARAWVLVTWTWPKVALWDIFFCLQSSAFLFGSLRVRWKNLKNLNANIFSIGYNWQPVFSDTFTWRACSAFEATKKNCPRGEPCMADLRSVHMMWVRWITWLNLPFQLQGLGP